MSIERSNRGVLVLDDVVLFVVDEAKGPNEFCDISPLLLSPNIRVRNISK
jgi:hypothetical protein